MMANPTMIASAELQGATAALRSIGTTSVNDKPIKEMPRGWSGARLAYGITPHLDYATLRLIRSIGRRRSILYPAPPATEAAGESSIVTCAIRRFDRPERSGR